MVCIDGLEDGSNPPKAATTTKTIEEASTAPAVPTETLPAIANEAEMELFSTGSEVMDDILEHSQLRMLEAFSHLSKRVDSLAASRRPVQRSAGKVDQANSADLGYVRPPIQLTFLMYRTALIHMRQRIEAIEDKQETFVDIVNQLRAGLATWEEETSSLDVSTHYPPSSNTS